MSRYPFPPYANGWFRIAYADEIASRGSVSTAPLSRPRASWLFRDSSGTASPGCSMPTARHLGAHLGKGGTVEGKGIRCPFHAWLWNGDGRCVDVPYAKRIPPRAEIKSWTLRERNGLILVWHHDRDEPPSFEIPVLSEVGSPDWTPLEVRRWTVKSPLARHERELRRSDPLPLRARHAHRARDRGRGGRPRAALPLAHEDGDARRRSHGRHRHRRPRARVPDGASLGHRRHADGQHGHADRRRVDRRDLRLQRPPRRRRRRGRRRGSRHHSRPREADGAGHRDLGAQVLPRQAAPVRRRRQDRTLSSLVEAVLQRDTSWA